MIATPMKPGGGPLMPVRCIVCDRLLGSIYHDGLTLREYAILCTPRCEALAKHARGTKWRELPLELRQVQFAVWMVNDYAKAQRPASVHPAVDPAV